MIYEAVDLFAVFLFSLLQKLKHIILELLKQPENVLLVIFNFSTAVEQAVHAETNVARARTADTFHQLRQRFSEIFQQSLVKLCLLQQSVGLGSIIYQLTLFLGNYPQGLLIGLA